MADLKGLLETVARALADQPDAVSVRESERRGTTVYELQKEVAAKDSEIKRLRGMLGGGFA